jgi:hypothetical protein
LLFVTLASSAPPFGLDQVSQTALVAASISPAVYDSKSSLKVCAEAESTPAINKEVSKRFFIQLVLGLAMGKYILFAQYRAQTMWFGVSHERNTPLRFNLRKKLLGNG